ncbi:MAG: toprim domain-containing protein, partial [Pseudomonadota bacterium]
VGRCPFHSPDNNPSLVVSPRKQYWCCHGACSANGKRAGGDVIEFAMRLWNVTFPEAVARLEPRVQQAPSSGSACRAQAMQPGRLLERVVDYYQKCFLSSLPAQEYLRSRGITNPEIIRALQVGFCDGTLLDRAPEGSKTRAALRKLGVIAAAGAELFLRCIVLPLRDLAGVVVGIYGRAIDRDQHLFLPGPRRGLVNAACAATSDELIITESVIDAVSFLEACLPNAIPIYGINGWTTDHDELLEKHRIRRVVLALDSDDAGQKASAAIAEKLTARGIDVRNIVLPAKDANELLMREGAAGFAATFLGLVAVQDSLSVPVLKATECSHTTVSGAAKEKIAEDQASAPSPTESASPSPLASSAPSESHASETPVTNAEVAEEAAPAAKEEHSTEAVAASLSLPSANLAHDDGAYVLAFEKRTYRIRGLAAIGVDRLRVNVRVEQDGRFHVDIFDLYSARSRRCFQEAVTEAFGLGEEETPALTHELAVVIEALERERLELRARGRSDTAKHAMSAAEREEAMTFLMSPNLIELIRQDFIAVGCVGEETAMLTGYLAAISRMLPEEALAVLFCARSGAGKSIMQKRIVMFVPAEALIERTCVTRQALFYKDENALVHKVLAIDEEGGAIEAAYALRSLQSAGYLSITSTRTDPQTGKQRAEDYRVNGPCAIFLTTAHPEALDYETRNRFIILTIDESKDQTRRILEKQRQDDTLDGLVADQRKKAILRRHHNAQRLLQPIRVVNNLAPKLAYPADRLILRREQKKYLMLIKTIALLHQYQRPRKTHTVGTEKIPYIEATEQDVALATELAQAILRRNLDELAPPSRSLLIEIRRLVVAKMKEQKIPQHHAVVDRKEIQQSTGLSLWHLRDYLRQLVEYEYIVPLVGRKGRRYIYELIWDGVEEDPAGAVQIPPSVLPG